MSDPLPIRAALRSAITRSMKRRDRQAAAVYRVALGAIDNAEAVPAGDHDRAGAIESSPVGVGQTEVPRRLLTEKEMIGIVVGEAEERRAAADVLDTSSPVVARQPGCLAGIGCLQHARAG